MSKDLDQVKESTDLEVLLSAMLSSTQRAIDGVKCSAYLWGRFKPMEKDDALVRKVMIKAFNMEAEGISGQLRLAKSRTVSSTRKTPSVLLKQAEEDSAIAKKQNEAADQLLQMSSF